MHGPPGGRPRLPPGSASREPDEEGRGVLEVAPDGLNEGRPYVPVDGPVVEGTGEVHHVPDDDLVVPDDRALLDPVNPEDRDLGPVDDRGRQDPALLPEGRDRERGALDVLEGELLLPRGRPQAGGP